MILPTPTKLDYLGCFSSLITARVMEASISGVRVLSILPKNYTYDHLNEPENVLCTKLTVNKIRF